ncbi:P-loop NTPase fold protein [Nonomuraea sp. 3N208]|uniref:P-loop NTPase fold protein n=1 Tax=Nonomuraea sp. 3N208 TaxID=3457421 RepID=UPI003FD27737
MTDEQHDELFAALLTRALGEPELLASMKGPDAPSAEELRAAATARRAHIMSQVRGAQERYQTAAAEQRARERRRRRRKAMSLVSGFAAALVFLAAAVAFGWDQELQGALAERRPVSVGGILGTSAAFLGGLTVAGVFAGFLTWWLFYLLSPRVRAKESAALDGRAAGTLFVAVGATMLAVAIMLAVSAGDVAWQLAYQRLPGPQAGYGWQWAVFGGAVVVLLAAFLWILASTGIPFAKGMDEADIDRLASDWHTALYESLLGFLRARISEQMSEQAAQRYATTLALGPTPGLRRVRGLDWHVSTPAEDRLFMVSSGMDGGSIALAGPRGVGKTELLKAFSTGDGVAEARLAVELTAPVSYDRREFMLHLFARLCERVVAADLKAAAEARRHLQHIRYLRTTSGEVNMGGGLGGWNLSVKRGTNQTRQPLSYPEIVQLLTDFMSVVAKELDGARPSRRLLIAIDELDLIMPVSSARDFLNELKVVFDVPHCLFVLSVSDEALKEADLSATGRRDAFDSAIDEVVRVEPLDYRTAVRLLNTRVIGLPEPFAALFYCLSGGMPRELLRTARAAVALVTPDGSRPLAEISAALVERELARIANSAGSGAAAPEELLQFFRADLVSEQGGLRELGDRIAEHAAMLPDGARLGMTLANRAYFLDTVSAIFSATLSKEQVIWASQLGHPGSFPALARAQHEIGAADTLARATLQKIRETWRLPALPPIPSPR